MVYEDSINLIGNTPMFKLKNMKEENMADVYVKLEKFNPGGSIKDRAALGMIEEAEKMGKIKPGDIIVEPTSGNTGIGLAMVGRLKGYKVIIVMPDSMSIERRNMIKAYGAELVLTEGNRGMTGAIEKAEELARNKNGYFIPQQFSNRANSKKHYETTAVEILDDVEDLDAFVASVGTGGTIAGIGRRLKEFNKNIEVIAVEPYNSPVISGGKAAPHKIQGIGAGFIPEVYEKDVVDEVMTITDEESYEYARRFGVEEGILIGISSGANIAAAIKIAKKLGKGKKVVTVASDGGEKYISTGLYDK
ncbi:cysteine synthase A [Clostridium sp. FAM 1755]|uniref:cysteine synthase A n=1 Tax=Clostridium caseinilyticum TaxID=3350403 RepID=UPI0038F6BD57